jgi:hypothetical protein
LFGYETERQGKFVVLIQAVRTRPGIQPMPEENNQFKQSYKLRLME